MSKILVTGVAGFLGSHLADALLERGHEVNGVDNLLGGYITNVPTDVNFCRTDCNDFQEMKRASKDCEVVFHAAATAYEGLSVFSPHLVNTNIIGAATGVFSAAISNGVRRIVHMSSMARYGALSPPFNETMSCSPCDPYGISKYATERMLENLATTHGVEHTIAVPHNIIGPRQKYDDPFRNVASIMINRMLRKEQPIIYGDGSQRRCFSFVQDCINCILKMGFQDNCDGEIINIGPDEEPITILDLAYRIADILCFKLDPIFMPGRPQEVKVALCSSNKARKMLGYNTMTSLEEGLVQMVDYIEKAGHKPFDYHLPIEILSPKTPKTWTQRLF